MADNLKDRLSEELKTSLKAGDKCRLSVIRLTMAAIKNAEIEKRSALTEPEVFGVLSKECKKRLESIEAFQKGNRGDLVAQEKEDWIYSRLTCQAAIPEEITAAVQAVVESVDAKPWQIGQGYGSAYASNEGKADGSL